MPFPRRTAASKPDLAALDLDPNAPSTMPPGRPQADRSRNSYPFLVRLDSSQPATAQDLSLSIALRQKAIAAAQQGYYIAALTCFRQLLRYGAEAQDYNHRGCIYLKMGQPIEAIADFDRAIDLTTAQAPHLAETYLNRGDAMMMTGAYDAALHNYSEAILLNPQDVRVWINRGIVLRSLRLYRLAIQSFDQALRLGSMAGYIYSERGQTYELTGDWNCACADYRRSIKCFQQAPQTNANQQMIDQAQSWLATLIDQTRR